MQEKAKKKWLVTIPIAGELVREVEAESEEEAIEEALAQPHEPGEETWETFTKLVEGNVFYGSCDKVSAEEID